MREAMDCIEFHRRVIRILLYDAKPRVLLLDREMRNLCHTIHMEYLYLLKIGSLVWIFLVSFYVPHHM